jgi:hypothetical protein
MLRRRIGSMQALRVSALAMPAGIAMREHERIIFEQQHHI